MRRRGLLINVTLIIVAAIIFYIVSLSYDNVEVGASVLLPDGSEQQETAHDYKILRSSTEVDSYGVRFSDVIYFNELGEVSVSLISSQASDDDRYIIRMYDFVTQQEIPIIRTGMKSQLYHGYENIYSYVDANYQGAIVVEVLTTDNKILERIKFWLY